MLVLQAGFFWAMTFVFWTWWRADGRPTLGLAIMAITGLLAIVWTFCAVQWSRWYLRK